MFINRSFRTIFSQACRVRYVVLSVARSAVVHDSINQEHPVRVHLARGGGRLQQCLCLLFVALVGPVNAAAEHTVDGRWRYIGEEGDGIREQIIERLAYTDDRAARVIDTPQGRRVVGIRTVRPETETVDRFMSWLDRIAPPRSLERIRTGDRGVITLTYTDGREREICTDCGAERVSVQSTAADGPQKLVIAAWEGDSLTIETNTNAGMSVLEVYRRPDGGNLLYVEYTIDANRFPEPIHATQVYVSAGSEVAAE